MHCKSKVDANKQDRMLFESPGFMRTSDERDVIDSESKVDDSLDLVEQALSIGTQFIQ